MNIGAAVSAVASSVLGPLASPRTDSNQADETSPSATKTSASAPSTDAGLVNGLTEQELKLVRELASRDREVRAHEQAHASVGGSYAGSPTYTYQRGPDGRQYAVGGEVSIDTAPVPGDPEATIAKARIVRRAALAPAQPSPQDRAVATQATAMESTARAELAAEEREAESPSLGDNPQNQERGFGVIDIRV